MCVIRIHKNDVIGIIRVPALETNQNIHNFIKKMALPIRSGSDRKSRMYEISKNGIVSVSITGKV